MERMNPIIPVMAIAIIFPRLIHKTTAKTNSERMRAATNQEDFPKMICVNISIRLMSLPYTHAFDREMRNEKIIDFNKNNFKILNLESLIQSIK